MTFFLIVQLTGDEAIVARFRRERGALVFSDAARHTVADATSLSALLREVAAANREHIRVILAVSPNLLSLREMEIPLTDRRKLRELLPLELKGETALDNDELVFDAVTLADGACLAIWGERRELAELVSIMTDAGLEPEIVTASMFHWLALMPVPSEEQLAITDGEALVVYRGGRLIYCRALPDNELAGELAKTLAALEIDKGIKVVRLFLHGSAARREAPFLEGISCTPLQVEGDLRACFSDDSAVALDLAAAYAVAKAVNSGNAVNFRSGNLAYTADHRRMQRKLRLSLILAVVCVFLLFAEAGLRYFLVERDLESLNASIRTIYREVFPNRKKPVDEVGELRSEIKRLGGVSGRSNVLVTLKKLAEVKGDEVTGFVETSIEGNKVRVQGDARSIQAVNDFRNRAAALFSDAEVGEIKSRPDGNVTFIFRGAIKEENK
ncbi:MAG: type II secretion system protein GspL [Geobacteraceae bacterium]